MLGRVSHIAEQAATNVSRRQFLGQFGRSAAATAAAIAVLLALPAVADAGKRIQVCSELSGSCSGRSVGSACGQSGTCRPVKSANQGPKSPIVDCYCRRGNFGH